MQRPSKCQKLFSFEEAFGESHGYEARSETFGAWKDCAQPYRDLNVDGTHVEHCERCFSTSKDFQPRRSTSNWSKLGCVVPRWPGVHSSNPTLSHSQRTLSNDTSGPKYCDCGAPGVSMSLKSSDPSEDVSVHPLFMRRLRSSADRDNVVGVRGDKRRNDLKKWYMVRNEEPNDYDGVMHAVFFDTY